MVRLHRWRPYPRSRRQAQTQGTPAVWRGTGSPALSRPGGRGPARRGSPAPLPRGPGGPAQRPHAAGHRGAGTPQVSCAKSCTVQYSIVLLYSRAQYYCELTEEASSLAELILSIEPYCTVLYCTCTCSEQVLRGAADLLQHLQAGGLGAGLDASCHGSRAAEPGGGESPLDVPRVEYERRELRRANGALLPRRPRPPLLHPRPVTPPTPPTSRRPSPPPSSPPPSLNLFRLRPRPCPASPGVPLGSPPGAGAPRGCRLGGLGDPGAAPETGAWCRRAISCISADLGKVCPEPTLTNASACASSDCTS